MSKAWLLRPMPHGEPRIKEFLAHNIVALGWCEIGNLEGKNKNDIRKAVEQAYPEYTPAQVNVDTSTLNIFANDMRPGDTLVVPYEENIYFATVESQYYYSPSQKTPKGYPHQRKVHWEDAPYRREDIPDALRQSLRAPRTSADLSHHYYAIQALLDMVALDNPASGAEEFVAYEYPIRLDTKATVRIPKNITQEEAARFGDFVKTLFFSSK